MKFDLSEIKLSRIDKKRGLKLPMVPSKELAEFVGILAGDGYVNFTRQENSHYTINIAGDSRLDYEYLRLHVKPLIEKLFKITPRFNIRNNQNLAQLNLSSKGLVKYLEKIGYFKHKSKIIRVPNWIKNNEIYMKYFIKGLADTDFSLMIYKNRKHYPPYPIVAISLKCKELITLLAHFLRKKGFLVNLIRNEVKVEKRLGYENTFVDRIKLSGRQNLRLWMNIIGFRNSRHLNKYDKYFRDSKIYRKLGRPSIQLSVKS